MTLFSFQVPNDNILVEIISGESYCVVFTKYNHLKSDSICGSYNTLETAISKFNEIISILLSQETQNKIIKILEP